MDTITLEEFNQLPHKEQVAIHGEMKNKIGVSGILEAWNLSRNKYYYMVKKRNLNEDKPKRSKKDSKPLAVDQTYDSTQKAKKTIRQSIENAEGEKVSFDITIQGSTEVVSTILESITEIYNSPNTVFEVNMSVRQI